MASLVITLYTNSVMQNNHDSKCNITHFEKLKRQMHGTLHVNKHSVHRTRDNRCMRVGGYGAVRELLNVEWTRRLPLRARLVATSHSF